MERLDDVNMGCDELIEENKEGMELEDDYAHNGKRPLVI
jgi:hypothetical protein